MAPIEAFGKTFDTDNITSFHKILIGVIVSILILGGGGYYLVYPQWETLQLLNEEIATQEVEIETKTVKVQNLDKLKEELVEIKKKLVVLRRKIPTQTNVAPLLLDIEEITENKALYGNNAY